MVQNIMIADLPAKLEQSWSTAQAIVEHTLVVPSPFVTLIRNSWCGIADAEEFVRLSGFTTVSPFCLVLAAGLGKQSGPASSRDVLQSLHVLGIRNSAVILAVNCCVRAILKGQPGSWWQEMLEDLAEDLCIGYRLGARVPEIGIEGGMLTGLGRYLGYGILSAWDKAAFRTYRRELSKQAVTVEREQEIFGCEVYQIAACALQALGFGAEVAFGMALAVGKLDCTGSGLDRSVKRWPAAMEWLIALKEQRNYPARLEDRMLFPAIAPARGNNQRNATLEVLYTEVARARQDAQSLVWHLPRPSYQATREMFGLA